MTRRIPLLLTGILLLPLLAVSAPVAGPAGVASASGAGPFAWGSDLSPWWSYDPAARAPALDTAKATGMTHVVTDAKDGWGLAAWSTPSYATFTPFAAGDGATERVVRDAQARGVGVIARFDAFEDHEMARRYPAASLGGSPAWVDPACPEVRAALLGMARDLVLRTGVTQVNLDHVRYPDTSELPATTPLPCTGGRLGDAPGSVRTSVITGFVRDAAAAIREAKPGVTVSASVFAASVRGPLPHVGQDAGLLAHHLDVLMPMVYPSYFSASAEADPYGTVKDTTAVAVQRFGAAKVKPWVQGFGAYAGSGEKACTQIKAAADAGASGAFVWWFASMGTAPTPWASAAKCVPAATSTAPAPAAFSATFSPKPGNAWWVETAVSANAPLAKVQASVEGGGPVELAPTSWGTWARSFHVPDGSRVRFTAVSAEGAAVTSVAYVWPGATSASAEPAPQPEQPAPFTATFTKQPSHRTRFDVKVEASAPLAGVDVSVDGGSPMPLKPTSWGTWARKAFVPEGATVVFTAKATDGRKVASAPIIWS